MDEIVAYQPDLVILSGDLTKDGELACHQDIHEMLSDAKKRLKAAGKEAHFAVINGNHDINNDLNGRDFSSGFAEHTDLVDPLAFKDLYADCGYDDAIAMFDQGGSKGGSLSYVVRPAKGVTLIAVDSCKYSTDQNGLDVDEHVTSGVVGEKLLQWLESQAKQARAAGDIVFVTQHHGVVPHFSMEPTLMGEYLVDNYEECQRRYADAGVSAVFTGHMHANDVACGYDDAIAMFDQGGSKGGSLSYVVRPAKGVTLIAVDSCKYSTDQNGLDVDEHVTSGVVGEKLLQWIESQAKQARAAGDIVFVTQHHGVVPHFSMEPTLMGEYLVDNYEECQRRYADAGVSAVFTGHMHANDIASITTEAGNTLFDIETCATVTYPSDIRFATLGWEREKDTANVRATLAASITTEAGNTLFDIETCATVTYPSDIRFATLGWEREKDTANVRATLALESHPLGSVDYTDFDSGSTVTYPSDIRFATLGWEREKDTANVRATLALESHPLGSVDYTDFDSGSVTRIPNIEEYGHERLLTVDVVKTMIADALVAPMLDQAAASGGVKPLLAQLASGLGIGDGTAAALDGALFGAVFGMLVAPMLDQAAASGGVKPLLAQLASGLGIGDGTAAALDGALFGAVFGMLPQSAEEAFIIEIPILGSAGIWANPENQRVMVQKMEAKAGVEPYALTLDAATMAAVQSALVSEPMAAAAGWSYYISAESLAKFLTPRLRGPRLSAGFRRQRSGPRSAAHSG